MRKSLKRFAVALLLGSGTYMVLANDQSDGDSAQTASSNMRVAAISTARVLSGIADKDSGRRSEAPNRVSTAEAPVQQAAPGSAGRTARDGAPAVEDDGRRRLARSLQTELRRVGCYQGAVDGEWGQASRRAMKAFTERVNATLPIDQPDYILLTLLQGHAASACGGACPPGQGPDAGGVCTKPAELAAAPGPEPLWAKSIASVGSGAARPAEPAPATGSEPRATAHRQDASALRAAEERARQLAEGQARKDAERARMAALDTAAKRVTEEQEKAEQARITAAAERRARDLALAQARAEAERLARVAEAEKVRLAAEGKRKVELSAQADRARAPAVAQSQGDGQAVRERAKAQAEELAQAAMQLEQLTRQAMAFDPAPAPAPSATFDGSAASNADAPQGPRFVGRFIPPPTYRVGRLDTRLEPRPDPRPEPRVQPRRYASPMRLSAPRSFQRASAPRQVRLRGVFNDLQRHSP